MGPHPQVKPSARTGAGTEARAFARARAFTGLPAFTGAPAFSGAVAFAAPPLLAVALFFLLPYLAAIRDGLAPVAVAGGKTRPAILSLLGSGGLLHVVSFTVMQALASTAAALAVGLPGAWILGSGRFRSAPLIRALASVPFAMPPILVVLGFVLFFGNAGWANRAIAAATGTEEGPLRLLYRPSAIVLAHAFYNFPIVLILAGDSLARSRASYEKAAESLGASPAVSFFTVLLPLAAPSVLSAAFLVFLYCFTSFAVVLVLGGGPAATTVPVEIYRAVRTGLDFSTAGALALVETAISAFAYFAYARFDSFSRRLAGTGAAAEAGDAYDAETRVPEPRDARPAPTRKPHGAKFGPVRLLGNIWFIAVVLLVFGPLLSIPLESFLFRSSRAAASLLSFRWWSAIGSSALPALFRSLLLAALSAPLACLIASSAAVAAWIAGRGSRLARLISLACVLPLASSGIVLGFGWIRLYGSFFARSAFAVAAVHAIAALPFAYRSISEGLSALPPQAALASFSLGASPAKTALFVALPAAAARFRSAWAFSAAISLGELNAVLMLGLDDWETLPLLIYRSAGSYRFGSACAAGTLLAGACVLAFVVSEKRNAA